MAKPAAGATSFTIDGSSYALVGNVTYSPSSIKREALVGIDGHQVWKETPTLGFIAAKIRDLGLRVEDFNKMREVNVSVTLVSGKQIIGTGLGCVDTQEVDTEDATFDVRFEGMDVTEIL
ncbi:phage tail tube protein [Siccirubricoccus sp. KC 17139]|uniref:Phage tail tube protein n=1 Tax=Siccirubricoccus soli TaxID=2899147 RepID=A0ABT1CYT3_9PROT|nr:phage tail tube protein [Siccirubricoccus soli]MCO6414816.1 phage tail tube protein [Siccirubricoccus soli]MCP2680946.1 phage tail tube protein [Siccirubricoccus soli]